MPRGEDRDGPEEMEMEPPPQKAQPKEVQPHLTDLLSRRAQPQEGSKYANFRHQLVRLMNPQNDKEVSAECKPYFDGFK